MPSDHATISSSHQFRFYLGLTLSIFCLHSLVYILDSRVQFFWGDSASYLWTAVDGYIPQDRSFVYGFLIRFLTGASQDLTSLVWFQILLFCLSSLIFAIVLREYFKISGRTVVVATLAASALPLHMIWTRYVMTESVALFLLSLFLLLSLEYLRKGRLYVLIVLQLVGVLSIAFRLVMIPPAIIVPLILPVLLFGARIWRHAGARPDAMTLVRGARGQLAPFTTHLIVSVALMTALHGWYQTYYAYRLNAVLSYNIEERSPLALQNGFPFRPAYTYGGGYFLLAFAAPLVEPNHFPKVIDGTALFARLGKDTKERRNRIYHRWDPDGLVAQTRLALVEAAPHGLSADQASRITAMNAIRQSPSKFLLLGINTLFDYWDYDLLHNSVVMDLGLGREADEATEDLILEAYGLHVNPRVTEFTFLKSAYFATLALVPLSVFGFVLIPVSLALHHRSTWLYLFPLCGILLYLNLALFMFAEGPNARYVQPVSWLLFIFLAVSTRIDRRRVQWIKETLKIPARPNGTASSRR